MSTANRTLIEVAAGIILRNSAHSPPQVLIAKRPANKDQGSLWEFPGGKLEGQENPAQALARELEEEIGIKVTNLKLFREITHQYSDKKVKLWFFKVLDFQGEPSGMEGQQIAWVKVDQLSQLDFPAANLKVIESLMEIQRTN